MVYKLGGCRFKSSCSHLNFRYPACFEEGVPWYSGAPKYCRFSLKYVADMIKTNGWNWFNGVKIFYFGFQKTSVHTRTSTPEIFCLLLTQVIPTFQLPQILGVSPIKKMILIAISSKYLQKYIHSRIEFNGFFQISCVQQNYKLKK